jgi:hypothetical protein
MLVIFLLLTEFTEILRNEIVHGQCTTQNVAIKKKLNSVALFRKRTIPTERPPLVGEVSANFCV